MKRTMLALLFSLPFSSPAFAQESSPSPVATAAPQAAAPALAPPVGKVSGHRLVGVILSSAQALLWDEEAGEYILRRVGDTVMGGTIVVLEDDHLVLERGENLEELPITAPPQKRVAQRRVRRNPPVLVTAAPDGPSSDAASDASVAGVAPAPPALQPPAAFIPSPAPQPYAVPPTQPSAPAFAPAPPAPAFAPPPAYNPAPGYVPPQGAALPPVAAPPPAAAPVSPDGITPPEGAPPMGPTTILPRSHLDRALADPMLMAGQVNLVPAAGGGFRVLGLLRNSFLHRAGLRVGDVVQRVDGRPINGPEDALRAATWLRLTDHFSVDIVRAGRPLTLGFVVQPS